MLSRLTKVLRQEWKFDGFVVSDYTSVRELINHGVAANEEEAAAAALNAGVEMEMVSRSYNAFGQKLLQEKKLSQATIDEAVRRILRIKFRLGLFDRPYTDEAREPNSLLRPESIRLAREIAGRSMVLLKNDRETLPLSKNVGSIAVIGPLADDRACATRLVGRRRQGRKHGHAARRNTKQRCRRKRRSVMQRAVTSKATRPPVFRKQSISRSSLTSRSFLLARLHDMVGEAASRSYARFAGTQMELVQAIHATGKPTVVVLGEWTAFVDRLDRRQCARDSRIVDGRQPGSGNAIADILVWRRESGRQIAGDISAHCRAGADVLQLHEHWSTT